MKKVKKVLKIIVAILILLFILIVIFIAVNNARTSEILNKVQENDDLVFKVLTKNSATGIISESYNSKDVIYSINNINQDVTSKFYKFKKSKRMVMISDKVRQNEEDEGEYKVGIIVPEGIIQAGPISYARNFDNSLDWDAYLNTLKNNFSIENLFYAVGSYFTSAKWISEETINGVECYKISALVQQMMGIDYSIYVSKYDYMPIRVHQGAFDNQNNITDFEYDYNVDMKVFQFPDLSDYYVSMQ